MGFTKLDSGIIDSSIWSEPLAIRVVWVTFLAKANYHGIVKASRSGMIRSSNVSEKDFDRALKVLESPDSDSRSPEFDGRRIEKIEGGWLVLNYKKYREYSYSESPVAIRQRRHREKKRDTELHVTNGRDISASASVSSSNISFDLSSLSWCGISDDDVKGWKEAYPACDIKIELAKMKEWVLSNKAKGKKSNWRRFITNWLSRSQDRGGTKKGKQSMADWVKEQEGA